MTQPLELLRWTLDHRRGLHPYDLSEPDLVAERAYRNLAGYGPLEPLLEDDDIWEVMVNAPDALRVAANRGRLRAQKGADAQWRSTRAWVEEYLTDRHKRQPKR